MLGSSGSDSSLEYGCFSFPLPQPKRQWPDSHLVSFNLFFFKKYVLLCVCVWGGHVL